MLSCADRNSEQLIISVVSNWLENITGIAAPDETDVDKHERVKNSHSGVHVARDYNGWRWWLCCVV